MHKLSFNFGQCVLANLLQTVSRQCIDYLGIIFLIRITFVIGRKGDLMISLNKGVS